MSEPAGPIMTPARIGQWSTLLRTNVRALADEFLNVIDQLATGAPARFEFNLFANCFLGEFCDPRFQIPGERAMEFVLRNHRISNLFAASEWKTTDAALQRVLPQQGNFLKLLTLYSVRNTIALDIKALFQINHALASIWFIQAAELYRGGLPDPQVAQNLERLLSGAPEIILPVSNLQEPYFGASYLPSTVERTVKAAINRGVQASAAHLRTLAKTPRNPRKIAVAATSWQSQHSVYRTLFAFIEALKPQFHLTLLQLRPDAPGAIPSDTSLFDDIRPVPSDRGIPKVDDLHANDFQAIVFPEVGMATESIILANLRLAPVQIALTGHPVSTFGADIDHFLSGIDVEIPDNPQQHYSERLILLPGMGCIHNVPLYTARHPPKPTDPLLIACSWQSHKCNAAALQFLAQLHAAATRSMKFRLFVGHSFISSGDAPTFRAAVASILPAGSYELIENLPYDRYMHAMEECSLALDSFHFGGSNTVSDALYLRLPILCREGDRWYNRIGPCMLRQAGLSDLIAHTEEDALRLAHRLIHDEPWRITLTHQLHQANLAETIYSRQHAISFAQTISSLLAEPAATEPSPRRDDLTN